MTLNAIGTSYDAVEEAIEREETERAIAVGSFEDYEVAVFAGLNQRGTPELTVCAGGEFEHYDDEEIRDEYVGGTHLEFRYDRVESMMRDFRQLADEYGLERVDS